MPLLGAGVGAGLAPGLVAGLGVVVIHLGLRVSVQQANLVAWLCRRNRSAGLSSSRRAATTAAARGRPAAAILTRSTVGTVPIAVPWWHPTNVPPAATGPAQATTARPVLAAVLRCTVAGAALTAPLPVTRTGRPSSSSTSIANGSACTTAGAGLGRLPGHGPSAGVRRWAGSARSAVTAGTHANASPGSRPPVAAGTSTCSGAGQRRQPGNGPRRPFVGLGAPAPQAQLHAIVAAHLDRLEPQHGDTGGERRRC